MVVCEVECAPDPYSYKKATASMDASKWFEAMRQEIESLDRNHLVQAPKNKRVVG